MFSEYWDFERFVFCDLCQNNLTRKWRFTTPLLSSSRALCSLDTATIANPTNNGPRLCLVLFRGDFGRYGAHGAISGNFGEICGSMAIKSIIYRKVQNRPLWHDVDYSKCWRHRLSTIFHYRWFSVVLVRGTWRNADLWCVWRPVCPQDEVWHCHNHLCLQ